MRAALIQMPVTANKRTNIETASRKLREAKAHGADLAILPEMFCCPYENACFRAYGEPEGGEAQKALSVLAAELELYVVGGSIPELEGENVYNQIYQRACRGRWPCVYVCVFIYIHTYICMCIYTHTYIYVYVCVCFHLGFPQKVPRGIAYSFD